MTRIEILNKLRIIFAKHIKITDISEDTKLSNICDLVVQNHIEQAIEYEFDIKFPDHKILESETVEDLINIIITEK